MFMNLGLADVERAYGIFGKGNIRRDCNIVMQSMRFCRESEMTAKNGVRTCKNVLNTGLILRIRNCEGEAELVGESVEKLFCLP